MRRMFSQKQIQELVKAYIEENGQNWDLSFKSVTTKIINVLSDSGTSYCPIDYDYQDADDHRLVILDNVQVSGDLSVSGDLAVSGDITGNSIIENMSGYSFNTTDKSSEIELSYVGAVKTGNKITFAIAGTASLSDSYVSTIGTMTIPAEIGEKLYPMISNYIANGPLGLTVVGYTSNINKTYALQKISDTAIKFVLLGLDTGLSPDTDYSFRFEVTFLLSENLAPQGE